MSAGDGNWTAVFSGTANRLAPEAGAGAPGASLGGSNCHGVSGEAGAKSRVSLQAPSSTNPAMAMPRNLAGGMQCILDRRLDHRLPSRPNLVENFADILVQHAVPRRDRRDVNTGTRLGRRFREGAYHLARSRAAAPPTRGLPEPS